VNPSALLRVNPSALLRVNRTGKRVEEVGGRTELVGKCINVET